MHIVGGRNEDLKPGIKPQFFPLKYKLLVPCSTYLSPLLSFRILVLLECPLSFVLSPQGLQSKRSLGPWGLSVLPCHSSWMVLLPFIYFFPFILVWKTTPRLSGSRTAGVLESKRKDSWKANFPFLPNHCKYYRNPNQIPTTGVMWLW